MTLSHPIDTYESWYRLKAIPGLGNILFKRLIDRFGSPEGVFASSRSDLKSIKGMGKRVLDGIHRHHAPMMEIRSELQRIKEKGFDIVTLIDPNYPPLLKKIPDPPPFFSIIGTLDPQTASVAIVGSRQATPYGLHTAKSLGYDLSRKGFHIISGMAVGIDTAAHEGALKADGKTIAVLGSGLAQIYPRENRRLFYAIADHGAVISEFPVHARPEARHFPMRNRIISGIATGTIVVEAAARSGSLITARLAAEYGREVFAVPGNINSSTSAGTHALLKQGAKLVENFKDVMEELHHMVHAEDATDSKKSIGSGELPRLQPIDASKTPPLRSMEPPNVDSEENEGNPFEPESCQHALLSLLRGSPALHIDTLIEQCPFDTAEVTAALLDLELSGWILQRSGKMFQRAHTTPLHRKTSSRHPLPQIDNPSRRIEE